MFWHADKPLYQKATSLKIAEILSGLGKGDISEEESVRRKQAWFEASIYILNKNWDQVDNFRIDKYLALLRAIFNQVLCLVKERRYEPSAT